jgi:hypothetical protein
MFQETQDKENFQARYVLRHAWAGAADTCPAAKDYFTDLQRRREAEASALAELTGWNISAIYRQAGFDPAGMSKPTAWWEHLWQ